MKATSASCTAVRTKSVTPACIMIDYDTMTDQSVTVRDRDTMKSERVSEDRLAGYLFERLGTR